jgi:hypothetical protein
MRRCVLRSLKPELSIHVKVETPNEVFSRPLGKPARYCSCGGNHANRSITPDQKRITLSDTFLLAAGMMIEIVSNQLWYYDSRGIDTCGELHEIARIVSSAQIEVRDFTRDLYDIATDTITIRAYWPDLMEINSLELRMPPPATAVSTCCLQTDRLFRPCVNDVTFKGATFCDWLNQRSWQGRSEKIRAQKIGWRFCRLWHQ